MSFSQVLMEKLACLFSSVDGNGFLQMVMEMSFLHVDMSFYKFDGNVNNEL